MVNSNYDKLHFTYFSACTDWNNNIWFFANEMNALCCVSSTKKEVNIIATVDGYDILDERLYGEIIYFKSMLILAPMFARDILVYDLHSKTYKKCAIAKDRYQWKNPERVPAFYTMKRIGDFFYLFGASYPGIIIFNPYTKEQVLIESWRRHLNNAWVNKCGFWFGNNCVELDNKLYVPCSFSGMIFEMDLENNRGNFIPLGDNRYDIWSICTNQEKIWCISSYDYIIRELDPKTNCKREILACEKNFDINKRIVSILYWKEFLVLETASDEPLWIYSLNKDCWKIPTREELGLDDDKQLFVEIFNIIVYEDKLLILFSEEGRMATLHIDENEIIIEPFYVSFSLENIIDFLKEKNTKKKVTGLICEKNTLDTLLYLRKIIGI